MTVPSNDPTNDPTNDGPSAEQMSAVLGASDPLLAALPMLPDEYLVTVARAVVAETERRGLDVTL